LKKKKYNENILIFLKLHFFTTSLLPKHSYTLFRVRRQTFFVNVHISIESENCSCGQEKALLPLSSCAAEHLSHSLGLEALGTGAGRWEQAQADG